MDTLLGWSRASLSFIPCSQPWPSPHLWSHAGRLRRPGRSRSREPSDPASPFFGSEVQDGVRQVRFRAYKVWNVYDGPGPIRCANPRTIGVAEPGENLVQGLSGYLGQHSLARQAAQRTGVLQKYHIRRGVVPLFQEGGCRRRTPAVTDFHTHPGSRRKPATGDAPGFETVPSKWTRFTTPQPVPSELMVERAPLVWPAPEPVVPVGVPHWQRRRLSQTTLVWKCLGRRGDFTGNCRRRSRWCRGRCSRCDG